MGISFRYSDYARWLPMLEELSVDIVELFVDPPIVGEEADVPYEEEEDDYSE